MGSAVDSSPRHRHDDVDLERDRSLVERCQSGDERAFEDLYLRYRERLHRFCLRRLGNPSEAEDAVQEAFARAWKALPTFSGERRFYPWLSVIAANLCTDMAKRGGRCTPVEEKDLDLLAPAVDGEQDRYAESGGDHDILTRALGKLSERHREVLELRESRNWTYQQIAAHSGVEVSTIETLLFRARRSLKREFMQLARAEGALGALALPFLAFRRMLRRAAKAARSLRLARPAGVAGKAGGLGAAVTPAAVGGAVVAVATVAVAGIGIATAYSRPAVPAPSRPASSLTATLPPAGQGALSPGGPQAGAAARLLAPKKSSSAGTTGGARSHHKTTRSTSGQAAGGLGGAGTTVSGIVGGDVRAVHSTLGSVGSIVHKVTGSSGLGGVVSTVTSGVAGATSGLSGLAGSLSSGVSGAVGGLTSGLSGLGGSGSGSGGLP